MGYGVHGTVFAAEANTKPGFFAVKFHREKRPFELECRVYQRLREEQIKRILGFNVPQLLSIDEEFRAIEMTIVRAPFLLDFADARTDEAPDFSEMFSNSGRKTKQKFSVKDGQRFLVFSQHYRRSTSICSISIQAIFPFLKSLGENEERDRV